ncbi:hypothetical protein P3342_007833 [Pyrenophora teres f. teres]|nr:hypothetical protein P3342_007833 [Pyrenophora teres f. teres]
MGLIDGASVDGPVLVDSSRDAACGRRDGRDDTSTFSAPSMSSYMSMASTAADFAEVPLDDPLSERPLRAGAGLSSTSDAALPLATVVVFFASLPEAFLVDGFAAAFDSMRFGVSSFLRLEDRGESSMCAIGLIGFWVEKRPLIDVRYRICVMAVMMGERLPLEIIKVLAQARQASKSRRARILRLLLLLHRPARHTNTISHFLASDIRQSA